MDTKTTVAEKKNPFNLFFLTLNKCYLRLYPYVSVRSIHITERRLNTNM